MHEDLTVSQELQEYKEQQECKVYKDSVVSMELLFQHWNKSKSWRDLTTLLPRPAP